MLHFHLSSDQWRQCKKCFWRLSSSLQNSIAPSSSLCILAMWKKTNWFLRHSVIGESILSWSTSVQILSPKGKVFLDELAGSRLCGFALAFDRHAKSLALNFNAYSSNCTSEVSCSLLFKFVTNVSEPWKFWPRSENCLNFCVSLDPSSWSWWSII